MGVLVPLNLQTVSGSKEKSVKYVASFSYDFSTDVATPQNLGGISFSGSLFKVNLLSLNNQVAVLPEMRSLQFTQSFAFSSGDEPDTGDLVIFVPSTGQLMRINYGGFSDLASLVGAGVVSGCVPIVSSSPTTVIFGKAANSDGSTMDGKLTGSLFSFDLPAFVTQGISYFA